MSLCREISEMSSRRLRLKDPADQVTALNRKLVGWSIYFCLGPVSPAYRAIDQHVARRLRQWLCGKHKPRGRGTSRYPDDHLYQQLGLVWLSQLTRNFPWAKGVSPDPRAGCGKTARPVRCAGGGNGRLQIVAPHRATSRPYVVFDEDDRFGFLSSVGRQRGMPPSPRLIAGLSKRWRTSSGLRRRPESCCADAGQQRLVCRQVRPRSAQANQHPSGRHADFCGHFDQPHPPGCRRCPTER